MNNFNKKLLDKYTELNSLSINKDMLKCYEEFEHTIRRKNINKLTQAKFYLCWGIVLSYIGQKQDSIVKFEMGMNCIEKAYRAELTPELIFYNGLLCYFLNAISKQLLNLAY